MVASTSLDTIESFLAGRRIALVGVSRDPKDFTRVVMRELLANGYEVVPINPAASDERIEIEGRRVHKRLTEVPGTMDGALVMTPAEVTPGVARDALEANVRRVWMHRGIGRGAVDETAVALLRARGVAVVATRWTASAASRQAEVKPRHGLSAGGRGVGPPGRAIPANQVETRRFGRSSFFRVAGPRNP